MRVLLIAVVSLLLAQERPAVETAAVEGIVVKQGTNDPIQGAVVTFTPVTGAAKTSTSGEDGKFTIANLTPGRYQVASTRTGFVKARRASGPANLTLAAGQRLADVRIQLTPTAVITGRVLDENGMPKSRVSVSAVRPDYQNGRRVMWPCYGPQNSRGQTNGDGEYRLFGLEPGEYYIAADLGGGGCSSAYYPGAIDPGDAVLLRVRPGAELGGIDIRPTPTARYSVRFKLELPPPLTTTVPITRTQIVRISRTGLATTESLGIGRGQADAAPKEYTSAKLAPGSYEIYYDNGLGVQIGHIAFDVVDRDIDAGTMVIKPAIALSGRILAPSGLPPGWTYNRANVVLRPLDLRDRILTRTLNFLSTAAADGTFMMAFAAETGSTERPGTIAEGRYQISLNGLVEDQYLASARYGTTDVLDTGLVVDGPQPGPMELTILNGGSIEGTVRNGKDEPVADSRVVIVPSQSHRGNLSLFKTGFTDQYGRFSLRGVSPGDYGVLAWEDIDNGAWESPEFLKEFESRAVRVRVSAGAASNSSVRVIPAP